MKSSELPIYLASKSPRRRKLLSLIFPNVHLLAVETPEVFSSHETPRQNAIRIAREKMKAAQKVIRRGIIVTADTIVVTDKAILGKPADADDAERMLKLLRGKKHTVYTGVAVGMAPENLIRTACVRTIVTFRDISDSEISRYVASGSPMDKAGAYGIQDDYGAVFVSRICGCYYNVVGIPLSKTHSLIEKVKNSAP